MDERLKDIDLIEELNQTFAKIELQLHKDKERWGDIWKERGLVWNNQNQETRFFQRIEEYFVDFKENGTPVPWEKIIGEAHICMVREEKLK